MTMVSQSGAEPLKPSKKGPKPINSSDIEKVFRPLTLLSVLITKQTNRVNAREQNNDKVQCSDV